jgi:dienelactone hydrolase
VGLLASGLADVTAATAGAAPLVARVVTRPDDDRGTWRVEQAGGGFYEVSWRSPTRLPLTSDRPRILSDTVGLVGVASVGADGRTLSVTMSAARPPHPDTLDVLLSGDRLDEAGRDDTTSVSAPALAPVPVVTNRVADPAIPGPHAVVVSDYTLDPVPIRGFREPVEMVGHVVEPAPDAVTGPRPLVLFLHGRHPVCYVRGQFVGGWPCESPAREIPSHLGYHYVQNLLASQGYATVSIRANGINAQDFAHRDGGAHARAVLVRRHLFHWAGLAAAHQVDLSRVVLVGHSRGGEGVNRASIRIPLSAPYRVVGQVLIAPTNFGSQTAPFVPTVTLLPYCDGDVIDLQGQRFTDVARDVVAGDPSLRSSVMVMGANHNFFNTEWTPGVSEAPSFDDWFGDENSACGTATDARLTASEQRAVGRSYVAGAVALFARGAEEFLPMYDGSRVVPTSAEQADVRTHALGGGRTVRRPAVGTSLTLPVGAETQFCVGRSDFHGSPNSCGRTARSSISTPHWPSTFERVPLRREFEMTWTAAGDVGGMSFRRPLDLTGRRLELRTIVDPALGSVRLRVRLTDIHGEQTTLTPRGGGRLPVLLRGGFALAKRWAQPVLVNPTGADIDLSRVARVELVGVSSDGRVWVLDVASAPSSLTAVPEQRLPTVNIGRRSIDEGAGGFTTARVPFTISGTVSTPAKLSVVTVDDRFRSRHMFTIDLAPGQTTGSIPVAYIADQRDDQTRTTFLVSGFVGRNLITDRYIGALTIRDDDPPPVVTVRPVERTVTEGENATFEVRLRGLFDYQAPFSGQVVPGPAPVVRAGDVSERWLAQHAFGRGNDSTPLHRRQTFVFGTVRPDKRSVLVSIPVIRDGAAESRESLTLMFQIRGRFFVRTIWVARST